MSAPRRRGLALLSGLLVALCAGCGGDKGKGSVLLITLDTTRADALSCYGNPEKTTPTLDALAADGVLFEAAQTVAPMTLPAHASLLTGLVPLRHGLRDNGAEALPAEALTIAEQARAAGHATGAFVSTVVLDRTFGLAQGFDVFSLPDRRTATEKTHGAERSARDTIDAALEWLRGLDSSQAYFCWVHLYDPHHPYDPPPPFAETFSTPYFGEVAAMDHEIGRLLDGLRELDLYQETFVLAVADHGEGFGDHGEISHGTYCYQSMLRVPLIARWPASAAGRRAGERSHELVSVVDVAPTLAEALGRAPLAGIDGLSFFSQPVPAERGLYFEAYYGYIAYGWSPIAGWMDGRGKYMHSSEPELYDWRADPGEASNLYQQGGIDLESGIDLERYLAGIAGIAALPTLEPESVGGDAETLESIRALGYAGSGESTRSLPGPLEPNERPGPRSQSWFFAQLGRATKLHAMGLPQEASEVYEQILEKLPGNYQVLSELAGCYMDLERAPEAVEKLTTLVRSAPPNGRHFFRLGLALLGAQRADEAVAPLLRALELKGGRKRYLDTLRVALVRAGRGDEMEAIERIYER